MVECRLNDEDFETAVRYTERAYRAEAVIANDAFVAAMKKAVKRGRENVAFGTVVDTTPPIGHVRIRGETRMSSCGSPAAMCIEASGAPSGAQTLK